MTPRTDGGGNGRRGPHHSAISGTPTANGGRAAGRGTELFTSHMVAELLGVSPRTVSKWIDNGKLAGTRLPAHGPDLKGDRRVYRDDLLAFARRHGLRLPGWLAGVPVACLADDHLPGVGALDRFSLGVSLGRGTLSAVIVGCAEGLAAAVVLAKTVRLIDPAVRLALLRADDVPPDAVPAGVFDAAFGVCETAAAAEWAAGRG